jgi:hypothetical protein
MNDSLERVAALAPRDVVDPDGLVLALPALERKLVAAKHPSTTARHASAPRRRLHLRRLALTGALAAGVTVAAIVLPAQDPGTPPRHGGGTAGFARPSAPQGPLTTGLLPAAAADTPGCAEALVDGWESSAVLVPRDEWAASPVRSLMALVGDGTPGRVRAYEAPRACPTAVATAVVYDAANTRGVNVYRDVASGPLTNLDRQKAQTIRGVPGHMLAWVNEGGHPRQRLGWVDGDGVRWYAVADGLDPADTVALLDGLRFDATGALDPASVPAGFRAAPVTDPAVGAEPTYTWIAEYAADKGTLEKKGDGYYQVSSPEYVYLEVSSPALEPIESRVAGFRDRLVDFDGVRAAWTEYGQGGAQLAWVADGVRYRLTAVVGSLDEMLAVARTVHPAAPDDARLR